MSYRINPSTGHLDSGLDFSSALATLTPITGGSWVSADAAITSGTTPTFTLPADTSAHSITLDTTTDVVSGESYLIAFTFTFGSEYRASFGVSFSRGTVLPSHASFKCGTSAPVWYSTVVTATSSGPATLTLSFTKDLGTTGQTVQITQYSTMPFLSKITKAASNGGLSKASSNSAAGERNVAISADNAILSTVLNGYSVAIGDAALQNNISSYGNVAVGARALQYSGSSADCVAIGMDVMRNQLYGGNNIGIGARAFQDGNLCYNSIAIGTRALGESIDGVGNVAIGTRAGENSTRTKHCVLIGDQAGADGNLTGTQNVGVGALSLLNLTTGANNTSVGAQSGKTITTQSYCAFFGYGAGSANTGPQSTALGAFSMENASGDTNTGAGYSAGRGVTTGAGNICIGAWTGVSVGSGSYNVILHGDWRSSDLTTGNRNIIIGYEADNPSGLASDWMNIGNTLYGAVCSASTKGILVTATSPSSSTLSTKAILQVDSTSQGALLPRMTTTQRDAITSPPEGLEIYNLTTHKKQIFTGSVWETITSA